MQRVLFAIVLATGLGAWQPAAADGDAAQAVGRLLVKGQASLEGPSGSVELSDTTHPYFAGDRVVAGAGSSVALALAGGTVTLEPGSAARARIVRSTPQIALERGTARVQFPPRGDFEVALGALRVRPQTGAAEATATDALVSFDAQQGAVIGSRAGTLAVVSADDVPGRSIAAGETRGFPLGRERALPAVSAPSDETALGERVRDIGLRVGGAAGLGGLGYGAYELADDDDDASPTR